MAHFASAEAPAKLNLGLKIVGKRPDGYHDLLSVFQAIDLSDALSFEEAEESRTEIRCADPALPIGPDNLIHRAVDALRRETGTRRGVRVSLTKVIPTGAGLGGGSSDAAATLRVLNGAWCLGLPGERLLELGAEIGSDVPFFLRPGTAIVSGRGERLRYVRLDGPVHYVLVRPPFEVSTAWAFRRLSERANFGLTARTKYVNLLNSIADSPISACELFACLENDFEPLVAETWPALKAARAALVTSGATACCMTGSGSVVFGVFFEAGPAIRAASELQRAGHRTFLCRPAGSVSAGR